MRILRHTILSLCVCLPVAAGEQQQEPGHQRAIIVSVQNHDEQAHNSRYYTQNDALQLRRVLAERSGVSASHIVEMTDQSALDYRQTLTNTRDRIEETLTTGVIWPTDGVLGYFSGDGTLVDEAPCG